MQIIVRQPDLFNPRHHSDAGWDGLEGLSQGD